MGRRVDRPLRGRPVRRPVSHGLNDGKTLMSRPHVRATTIDLYREISLQIRAIFAEYTALIDSLSLHEAHLDVTEDHKGVTLTTQIAEEIRATIREQTALTASASVSYNTFLAELASAWACGISARSSSGPAGSWEIRMSHPAAPK